jgi:flagellar hook-basal body complex protein FliE
MNITAQFAAQSYGAAKPATQAEAGSAVAAVKDFAQVMQQGEQAAQKAVTGGVDPHTLVQALAQTELAVQTAVTVRDKVVEAYQEILRMPV